MRLSGHPLRRTAWLALACHVIVASGVPVPLGMRASSERMAAGHVAKDRSRPFPCMDKACGCATAEQCFASCCCHTPAQRLAWASDHGLEAAVLAALERRAGAAAARPAQGCCATASRTASCSATAAAATVDPDAPEVCGEYRSLAAEPAPAPAAEPVCVDDDSEPAAVILRDMLACGGILAAWLACVAALPPPVVACERSADPAGAVACGDEAPFSERSAPDAPPPRA